MESDLFLVKNFKIEAEKNITTRLAGILEKKPDLDFSEIMRLISDIRLYNFYSSKQQKEGQGLIYKVLDIYADKLSDEEKFSILFAIDDKNSFIRFALKHYDSLRKKLKKRVFIPRSVADDWDEIEDFQYQLDCLYESFDYKAEWWSNNLEISIELYKLFGDDIKLLNGEKIEKYCLDQLYLFEEKDLEELFINEISRANPQNIGEFLVAFSARGLVNNNTNFADFINTDQKIEKVLKGMHQQIIDRYLFFNKTVRSGFSKIYNDILRKKVGKINNDRLDSIFSLQYLKAMNELESYSKDKLVASSLYLKCFKLFLAQFKCYYEEPLTGDSLMIVEKLFRRTIKRKDIFNILYIKDEKSLWHFYKADELIDGFKIPLEIIKRNNIKQYRLLKNKYIKQQDINSRFHIRKMVDCNDSELIINLIDTFGFDFMNKLIYEKEHDLMLLHEHCKNKSEDYKNALKKVLVNGISSILKNTDADIRSLLACFDTLYDQGCNNITVNRLSKSLLSLSYVLIPSNIHIQNHLEKLNMVAKGDPLLEKIEGIKLYDKYRLRIVSSIPNICGSYLGCDYSMVDLHSPEIISNGIGKYLLPNNNKASSCLTPNGKAASCLRHGALNPNGRFFKVEYYDSIVAYSWVWRAGDVICFDNIEITDEILKIKDYEKLLFDIYKQAAGELMEKTQKEEDRGVQLVILGKNGKDLTNRYIDRLEEVDKNHRVLFKPNVTEEIYLKDSQEKQFILSGNIYKDIQTKDVDPIYKYQRPKVMCFSDLDNAELIKRTNAIYFNYCLNNNKKYQPLRNVYSTGYLGEDWFVGVKEDNSREFYFYGCDERLFLEARDYVDSIRKNPLYKLNIICPDKEIINSILNAKDIEINYEEINKYLKRTSKEQFDLLLEYYTHNPGNLNNFAGILKNKKITSSEYGKHWGGLGCNGKHFISVAKVNSDAYNQYLGPTTFIIDSDICVFSNQLGPEKISQMFKNSSYPFRNPNLNGEYHVLNSISLEKAKAIFATMKNIPELVKIIHLQELFANSLPLVEIHDKSYIDKDVIKKYCKIRK